jgi:hypothetical protein
MATYKFEEFNVEISNPTITINSVTDFIGDKKCNVNVTLETEASKFGLTFMGFGYTSNWTDTQIMNWLLNTKLPMYLVTII